MIHPRFGLINRQQYRRKKCIRSLDIPRGIVEDRKALRKSSSPASRSATSYTTDTTTGSIITAHSCGPPCPASGGTGGRKRPPYTNRAVLLPWRCRAVLSGPPLLSCRWRACPPKAEPRDIRTRRTSSSDPYVNRSVPCQILTASRQRFDQLPCALDVPSLGMSLADRHAQRELALHLGVSQVDLPGGVELIHDPLVGCVAAAVAKAD
jgi:hypothetical protein